MTGLRASCQQREASESDTRQPAPVLRNLSVPCVEGSGCRRILTSGVIIIKKYLSPFGIFRFLMCGAVSVVLLAGCVSPQAGGAHISRQRDVSGVTKIAVAPFRAIASGDPAIKFDRCPVCGTTFRACRCAENPEKKIEEMFLKELKPAGRYTVIPPQQVDGVYKRVSTESPGESPLKTLTKVGKKIGADGIIAGYLFYYRERKGFGYSVEKPASVAFCVHLVRVEDGVSVWKGVFDKTQSSLMENILDIFPFIRGGGKWMTAEELSREGIRQILKDFPDFKGE